MSLRRVNSAQLIDFIFLSSAFDRQGDLMMNFSVPSDCNLVGFSVVRRCACSCAAPASAEWWLEADSLSPQRMKTIITTAFYSAFTKDLPLARHHAELLVVYSMSWWRQENQDAFSPWLTCCVGVCYSQPPLHHFASLEDSISDIKSLIVICNIFFLLWLQAFEQAVNYFPCYRDLPGKREERKRRIFFFSVHSFIAKETWWLQLWLCYGNLFWVTLMVTFQ